MRIKLLQCLVAVAEDGSASGAAQALGISQPAVTRQLQTLERIVGEPLFERANRPWRLTPAGERTVRVARATLRTVESVTTGFETMSRGPVSGALQIGLAQTAGMLLGVPLLRAALRHHDVDQQVEFQHADSRVLLEHLLDGALDLAWVDDSVLARSPGLGVRPIPMVAPCPPADAESILGQALPDGAAVTDSLTLISEDVLALAQLASETDAVLITVPPLVAPWVRAGILHPVPLDHALAFASRVRLAVSPHRALPAAVLGWVRSSADEALVAAGARVLPAGGQDSLFADDVMA
jgi:DNA-binding transcriptional LysR family regulator